MKKIFKTFIIGIIAIFFLIPNQIFAAPYPLTAIVGDKGITVTMSGVPTTDTSSYQLYNGTNPIVQNDLVGTDTLVKKATNGSVVWVLGGLAFRNGTYAFHVERLPVGIVTPLTPSVVVTDTKTVTVTTSTTTSDFFTWPLLFPITSGQTATVIGKIDTLKYPNTDGLSVEFSYTKTPFTTTTTPSDLKISKAHKSLGAGSVEGVASDGSYYFEITDLTPDTKYYFRQTITDKATGAVLGLIKTDDFNSTKGYTPAGSVKDNADFDSRSYRLLAPWPGLAVLMDPDLCAEKKAEGSLAPGAICDVNGFLNFAFKLLIGLTAVVLVLRLMYEGYQYMVTDVPFLKASAKSGFFTALLGLLLALSAYLILNTINPKLVNNQITIDSVEVGVEVWDRANDPAFIARLDSVSIAGVTANINDETFLAYLAHQQGVGGANAILRAAKNGTVVPSNINNNMNSNFNRRDAQRTIGTSQLSPVNFLNYWSIKVAAFKKNPRGNIPDIINTQLTQVSQETSVPLTTLQVMCRIESGCNGDTAIKVVNQYGYAGLFQLSNQEYPSKKTGKFSGRVWETYKKPNGILLDAYHNTYAGAQFLKANLAGIKR